MAMWPSRSPIPITSVVAVTPSWGIGQSNVVPWQAAGIALPNDMEYFKKCTKETRDPVTKNIAVMGRRTWESIPPKRRPLVDRVNIVLSTTLPERVLDPEEFASTSWPSLLLEPQVMRSFDQLLDWASDDRVRQRLDKIVVVGGASLFEESYFHPWFRTLHLTLVDREFSCDTYLSTSLIKSVERRLNHPQTRQLESHTENGVSYRYAHYSLSVVHECNFMGALRIVEIDGAAEENPTDQS